MSRCSSVNKKRAVAGFTLIEVLMTLVLTAILVTVAIPQVYNFSNDAKTAVTINRMNSIRVGIIGDGSFSASGQPTKLGYEINCLGLPATLSNLITQPGAGTCAAAYNPFTQQGWRGPYVSATDSTWNLDAWGTALVYTTGTRTLQSCGPDLTCGTADDIKLNF